MTVSPSAFSVVALSCAARCQSSSEYVVAPTRSRKASAASEFQTPCRVVPSVVSRVASEPSCSPSVRQAVAAAVIVSGFSLLTAR
ncbi:hypothetical protein [Modestobacter versicolor]|uniref:hypothetical protein n=1 Tax=Modestobacter versicolor TaxID=429133 RepID=UPI0034D970F3